jgi:hypothetical protein
MSLAMLRSSLTAHPVYERVRNLSTVRVFMEHHVFAVWDFMSLLKSLQCWLTCTGLPWLPPPDVISARLINEIVLGEECDEDGNGSYSSHFDLYLAAMRDVGADVGPINAFLGALRRSLPASVALVEGRVPAAAARFVQTTLDIAQRGRPHEVAAAFFYGREQVIPDMFQRVLDALSARSEYRRLRYYLQRHIDVDGDAHGPAAERMLQRLCHDDPGMWREAAAAARRAVEARVELWDTVIAELDRKVTVRSAFIP